MQHYIAGIDTGGTCTDGVIINTDTRQVVATAKVSTTHYDLSQGISEVLGKIIRKSGISADQLAAASISTTLATTVSFPPFSAVGNAVGVGLTGVSRLEAVNGQVS